MNLKHLSTFVQVAELQSLARAAVASDTAASLVSRQIAMLEAEWGGKLFDRTGRGMVLSDFGRRMLPEVQQVIEQLGRLDAAAREAAGTLTGTVHVGVLPSMSRELLPALFADIRARAPNVRLHAVEGFSGDLDEALASGRLDMTVVNRYGASLRGEDALGTVDTCLIGRPDGLAGSAATVPFRALAGLPLVLPSTPNGLRATLDQLSRKHRIALDVVMEVDTGTAMKDVALSGHAFTLLPLMAVKAERDAGLLAAARIVRPGIVRTISLSLGRRRPLSKAARLVAGRVRQLATVLLRG